MIVMTRTRWLTLVAIAGCGGAHYADPYASPDFSRAAQCDRDGGYWNRTANVCEMSPRH